MTRADEIADAFEAPVSGGSDLLQHHGSPVSGRASERSDGVEPGDGSDDSDTHQHGPLHLSGHLHLPHHAGPAEEPTEVHIADEDPADREPEEPAEDSPAEESPVVSDPAPAPRADRTVQSAQHETLPNIARTAAGGLLQAAGWTAGTSLRVSNQLRKLAVDPGSAQDVIDEVTREVREVARDFLGITELANEVQEMAPLLSSGLLKAGGASAESLRAQGDALLRAAADVGFDESAHPAFARMLTELSPDEARILRLLSIEGPQPMVDIRASNLIGNGSQLIAQSLNMLGPKGGLRQRERMPVYLTNLTRLSLVDLFDDPLQSPVEYQVLEAQPEVLATLRNTVRAKTVRRSIGLTPLGQEFCEVCLPVNLPALPAPRDLH